MKKSTSITLISIAVFSSGAIATCPAPLPSHAALKSALVAAVTTPSGNGGLGNNMWATVVTRDGTVCDVVYSALDGFVGRQWPGSRVISAQKANTANAFSLPQDARGFNGALSTANLYSAVQPGGSLFGLQESNPVHEDDAYNGSFSNFGTPLDSMIGHRVGGVNVFGGGLALYDANKSVLGGIGVSGDSSCADHNVAWRVRAALKLDNVPKGVSSKGDDNIIYDIVHGDTSDVTDVTGLGKSVSGWGHPICSATAKTIAEGFPKAGSGVAIIP